MQPESTNTDGNIQPEAQVQPTPVQSTPVQPVPTQSIPRVKRKNPIGCILIGLLVFLLLGVIGGIGYWDYTLNNINLPAAQRQLSTLQGKYDTLVSNNQKLTADLAKANSDLDKNNADLDKTGKDLTTVQGDLTKAQQSSKDTQDRLTQTSKLMDVVDSIMLENSNEVVVSVKVLLTKDTKLNELWLQYMKNKTRINLNIFFSYLLTITSDNLKK